ncbi:Protein_21.1 [Hexamita inflata]|uniref:Protein 21.1 n=1 Tax=Hexamita inflata TaxID=28002 RepID=A0AA86RE05_9EUKA|nr:Protein 21.1 [Hexamita inflata]
MSVTLPFNDCTLKFAATSQLQHILDDVVEENTHENLQPLTAVLEKPNDNSQITYRISRLMIALIFKRNNCIQHYINDDIFTEVISKLNPLHIAIYTQNDIAVEKLLGRYRNIPHRSYFQFALSYAPDYAQKFIFDKDQLGLQNETSLMVAILRNNLYWVEKLIYQAGVVVDQRITALAMANSLYNESEKSKQIIKLLLFEYNYSKIQQLAIDIPNLKAEMQKSLQNYIQNSPQLKYLSQQGNKPYTDDNRQLLYNNLQIFQQNNKDWCKQIDMIQEIDVQDDEIRNIEIENQWKQFQTNIFSIKELLLSPLMYAVLTNNITAVQVLKQQYIMSKCIKTGITALLLALRVGNTQIADLLLEERDMFTFVNKTPFSACITGGIFQYGREHFDDQKDIFDFNNESTLLRAVMSYDKEAFKHLLYQAYNLNKDSYQYKPPQMEDDKYKAVVCYKPLQAAAEYSFNDFLYELMQYQATQNLPEQQTALMRAVQFNNLIGVKLLVKFEARILLEGASCLMYAAQVGNAEAAQILIDYEADIQYGTMYAADYAIYNNKPQVLDVILAKSEYFNGNPIENAIQSQQTGCLQVAMKYLGKRIHGFSIIELCSFKELFDYHILDFQFNTNQIARSWAFANKFNNQGAKIAISMSAQQQQSKVDFYEYEP